MHQSAKEDAMEFARRQFLSLAGAGAALAVLPRIAASQAYPARPVRIVVGFAAGGPTDIVARVVGQWLSERLGRPFIIENRPGAGGNIGIESVVRAPADGYTLLLFGAGAAISATLYDKLNFNFIRDVAPVAGFVRMPGIIVVNPSVPARTVAEFIAHAKGNPGRISMGSAGIGTAPHVSGELFNMMAGVNMIHVPYRGGGPAMADLLSGQTQVEFSGPETIEYIKAGRLRALAVTTATRWDGLPELPTVSQTVPGYEASAWFGVGAPKGTPAEIIGRLNQEINTALADAKMKSQIASLGATGLAGSPTDFGKLIVAETEKWAKVVKFAGLKPE